jgi:hypothetical protein
MSDPVNWPSGQWVPERGRFALRPVSVMSTSPYTGATKAIALAQLWVAEITWHVPDLNDAIDLQAFLESLDGPATPIRLFDWWRCHPRGFNPTIEHWSDGTFFSDGTGWSSVAAAPTVKIAAARGAQSITLKDMSVSKKLFKRGDLFEIAGGLYEAMGDVTANASGEATMTFRPGLRTAAIIGDAVVIAEPRGTFRLTNEFELAPRSGSKAEPFSLTFIEDVP